MRLSILAGAVAALALTSSGHAFGAKALMLHDSFPGSSEAFYSRLKQGIEKSGLQAEEVSGMDLAGRLAAGSDRGTILVLPNAVCFPVGAKIGLDGFLKKGNHLLAISGPAFTNPVSRVNGRWVTREQLHDELAKEPGRPLIDLRTQDFSKWLRSTPDMQNKMTADVAPSGQSGVTDALHLRYDRLDTWEVFQSPSIASPFQPGEDSMVFWAKGDPGTSVVRVQWKEKDGTRWIATVKLTPEWKRHVLLGEDFLLWHDGVPAGRGGVGDRFHPENADKLSFIEELGPSQSKPGEPKSYWISDIRAIRNERVTGDQTPLLLESISPAYKVYRTKAHTIEVDGAPMVVDADVTAPVYRSRGLGSDAVRKWRFIPIARILDEKGEDRGSAAHLFLNTTTDYSGSIWGFIGLDQASLERTADKSVGLAVSMLKRMSDGLFFANAGSDRFAYLAGEKTVPGAYVTNCGSGAANGKVEITVTSNGKAVDTQSSALTVGAGSVKEPVKVSGRPISLQPGEYTITASMMVNGREVDRIAHPFRVVKFGKVRPDDVVSVKGGDFWLHGKKWYPLGINYWPTFSAGLESEELYAVHWLGPQQYDPEAIERDLQIAERLKINSMSIQYYKTDQSRPLIDFLARAEKHGIKVNCFVEGLHPLNYNMWSGPANDMFKVARELITAAHLQDSPTVYTYDLGWEVHVGPYTDRVRFDKDWQGWVVDRYGSIESASTDWGYQPVLREGVITGPSDDQLQTDGDWRRYVAAYRRFWDDEISKRYRIVREDLATVDPIHLAGARSGYGGTGSLGIAFAFPFDLASGAKHLDYISPEGYAIGNNWEDFLHGGLNCAYGRYWSGGKPIFWAEYGQPIVIGIQPNDYQHGITPETQEAEKQYYHSMIEMNYLTGANGSAGWWWPGGFRLVENSDFGIINPDGTPRLAALEIAKAADGFYRPREIKAPDTFITIDRDAFVAGYAGVYENVKGRFATALKSSKNPGVRTEGTGTTSANTPLVAVGNGPCNGHNPPKYLNAEFNWLKINGRKVDNGATVPVEQGKPIHIEASLGNIAEAKWLAPKASEDGAVYLIADISGRQVSAPIAGDAPFLSDAQIRRFELTKGVDGQTQVAIRMSAKGRTRFGEVFRVTLSPK